MLELFTIHEGSFRNVSRAVLTPEKALIVDGALTWRAFFSSGNEDMVGNPREKSSDWPNIVREGIEPEVLRVPDWRRYLDGRDYTRPFQGIPLPGSRTPSSPPRLPSWFEDPSQPGLPPSLKYPAPGNPSPGFPPIPAPVPAPSPIPGRPIRDWLFDYLLGNNLLDQRPFQQTSQSALRKDASRTGLDPDMRLAAAQQADQGHPTRASQTGSSEEPSKPQKRFLRSRVE
ncbi:hypothetical protein [Bradyrhizobium sp. SZCCHNRI3043]|uniref:hypothetical protein n=1 Tax=Bradyrhizobium sp. SZCCHNRI3043 TaxID=3057292 RepID=UPI0028E59824|nr:hypothetical protein [Bradyrhizobium sp. SZCCHNRI3043]